ncbi:hypothetical protein F4778DRAFT_744012 [Xylariomycetidae sp. FL2044]|nr:hypothetical protein F4778DRAFT_744012 [Xylariomycetidae sp. FL2044]
MHEFATLSAAALLLSTVSAMPNLRPRETDSLQEWVTVDEDGQPSTVTPLVSTVDGTPTTIDAAPNDLTATVFTQTNYGKVTTTTGTEAPAPTATGKEGGAFNLCSNTDGEYAPWCAPSAGTHLWPGWTYYFTWDPTYFNASNTTIVVQGNYVNETTGAATDQAFESNKTLAAWGFWSYKIEDSLLRYQKAKNISLQLAALATGTQASIIPGPTILVTPYPTPTSQQNKIPSGAALYIALPTVFSFIILCLIGTCIWNRKARKIDIGNIMSRSRHGYGAGKSSRSRMGLRSKKNAAHERIQLMEREVQADGGELYRDQPERPRRDSDALGSLAGTPTEDRRMDFPRGQQRGAGEGNLFRDELRRQDNGRF